MTMNPESRAPLLEALVATRASTIWRGSTPGHKGGPNTDEAARKLLGDCFSLDFPPETLGVDQGSSAVTPLEEARRLFASAYRARTAWFLTQGATQGVLAALIALSRRCSRILVQRGSHFSVFSGLALSGLQANFVAEPFNPDFSILEPLDPAAVERALHACEEIDAVFVTSPSYFGAVADIAGIREITRRAGVSLVVDGSWGPHFGLHKALPPSPIALGADIVIVSTHKHLGSLTQSAAIMVGAESDIGDAEIEDALRFVTSTSPSIILAASVDAARRRAVTEGDALVEHTPRLRRHVASALESTPFSVLEPAAPIGLWADPLRLFIDVGVSGWTGCELGDWLERERGVVFEVANDRVLGFVLGFGERLDALKPLVAALQEAASMRTPIADRPPPAAPPPEAGEVAISVRTACFGARERVDEASAEDRIAAETVAIYPPGIPLFVAGERIDRRHLRLIEEARNQNSRLYGLSDVSAQTILVTAEAGKRQADSAQFDGRAGRRAQLATHKPVYREA